MNKDFFESKIWMTFVGRSPFVYKLSNPDYVLAIDSDKSHFEKENAHWHLCYKEKPIARITAYGCWTSFPKVPTDIRLEAEAITSEKMIAIIRACGKTPISEPALVSLRS
jgi:hypothetical protein